MKEKRALMVCLGNICRSPLAEGIVEYHALRLAYPLKVDSCGTSHWHSGEQADERAISVARKRDIDIAHLRARQFHPHDFDRFDILFAMDHANKQDLLKMAKTQEHRDKVHVFLEYAGMKAPADVPDPYYGDESDFIRVFELLDQQAPLVLKRLFEE